jgi:hypothetical protein
MFKVQFVSMVRGERKLAAPIFYNNEAQMRRGVALYLAFGPGCVAAEITPCFE